MKKREEKPGKQRSFEQFVDATRRMAVQLADDLKGHIIKRRGIMARSNLNKMSEKAIILTILGQVWSLAKFILFAISQRRAKAKEHLMASFFTRCSSECVSMR